MGNKSINKEPMAAVNLHVPRDLYEDAEMAAHKRRVSRAQVLREWLELGRENLVKQLRKNGGL